jgi:hypothetical protein
MLQKIKENWQPLLIGAALGGIAVYLYTHYQTKQNG